MHENATSNVLAWSHHAANVESAADDEGAADVDEPPDSVPATQRISPEFRRTSYTKAKENHASLLTRALNTASESETPETNPGQTSNGRRRRPSITSEISVASTADLTSDTGMSTPARTNSPSPRLLGLGFVPLSLEKHNGAPVQIIGSLPRRIVPTFPLNGDQGQAKSTSAEAPRDPAVQTIQKKRCISFACTAKPKGEIAPAPAKTPVPAPVQAPAAAPQPTQARKPCIKFACPAKPPQPAVQQTPPQKQRLAIPKTNDESGSVSTVISTPSTIRKARSPVSRRARPMTPRKIAQSPVPPRKKKYITASSDEMKGEGLQFHEFASDHPQQEDWIRREKALAKTKLTIDDLLKKENDIRRIGKEAEEEAQQEEEEAEDEDDAEGNGDEDDDGDDAEGIDELEEDVEDDQSGYGSDDDFSDGYNTDEDLGFAESDDEEDDGLLLWTLTTTPSVRERLSDATPVFRPSSLGALSDSSAYSRKGFRTKHSKQRSIARPMTPELPDSTDFVCGTMDEDLTLEDEYATRLAARKREKYRTIPQDIDPSFPTSDPEDEVDEDLHHSHDSGEPIWLHGELEDLHDDRIDRRLKKKDTSPKRMRSPPPAKRYHSPPPKARGRSPRRLFDRSSPRRVKSPAPMAHPKSPMGSPAHAARVLGFKPLAARPGLTHTKSLPRGAYFPGHIKSGKRAKPTSKDTAHVRGAIDIVKGLEQKRQRRKEKFHQKYCDRARKGQIPEKRTKAGEGAEKMRELGLISAGKIDQGNYVISI